MNKYLKPLYIFVGGQFLLLVGFLFLSPLDTAGADLAANTTAMASTFWGWGWAPTVGKWVFIFAYELGLLYATARAFVAVKD